MKLPKPNWKIGSVRTVYPWKCVLLDTHPSGVIHLCEVESVKLYTLCFTQTMAQSRDEMGTWAMSEWLWMALKTSLPCTAPGKEWFPSIQKEVSVAGRSEGWWCASSREETSGKIYSGESARKCTDIHSRVAQMSWLWELYMQGRVWCEALESTGLRGLVQTFTISATSQSARAPWEVGLDGLGTGSPATSADWQRNSPHWNYSGASVTQSRVWAPFCFGDLRYKMIIYTEYPEFLFIEEKMG